MMKKSFKDFCLTASLCALGLSVGLGLNGLTASASEQAPDFQSHGASVRTAEPTGLRFAFSVSAAYKTDDYSYGTLIIPKDVLGENTLNHNDDSADEIELSYTLVEQEKWATEAYESCEADFYEEGREYFNAVLNGIPEAYYGTTIVARAYAVKEGVYCYGDTVERSIAQVAASALKSGEDDVVLTSIVDKALGDKTLSLNAQKAYVGTGKTQTLSITNGNDYAAIWTSSDKTVATVDENGVVKAKAEGTATITAKIGSKTAEAQLQVGALLEGDKLIDFTSENVSKQLTGGNATIGYSNDILFDGDGLMTATNTMNWQGTATVSMNLSYYSTVNFAIYQNNGGGREVQILAKDAEGEYTVELAKKSILNGTWANVEIDVSELTNQSTDLKFVFGTGLPNGSEKNVFYFTDFYGEELEKVVDFTADSYSTQATVFYNTSVGYSNDVLFNGEGALTVANTINWIGSAKLLNSVDASAYSKIVFSVYQKTGGGRTVTIKKATTSGNVQLVSTAIQSGVWTKFEINVSDLPNSLMDLIFLVATGGENGNMGDTFYFSDIYGVK